MTREGGWQSHRAYPLILSVQAELAVQKFRIERGNLSMGKALNQLVNAGLISFGYLVDPAKCQHEYHWVKPEGETYSIAKCLKCGKSPDPGETVLEAPEAPPKSKSIFGPPSHLRTRGE